MPLKKTIPTESKPLFKQITFEDYIVTVSASAEALDSEEAEKESIYKNVILDHLPRSAEQAIRTKELTSLTGLTVRELKVVITRLRYKYPICAKETGGGGYWLATDPADVLAFIQMIIRRKAGYEKTIKVMTAHLIDM